MQFFLQMLSNFFNRVIALTQSVKIQISKTIWIEYALFAQNSIVISIFRYRDLKLFKTIISRSR